MGIITKKYIQDAFTYEEYRQLGKDLISQGKTTGPNQSQDFLNYSKLNDKRMDRVDKTQELEPETIAAMKGILAPQYWVVITELWCGDAAISLPVIEKMAAQSKRVRLSILLRDDNTEVMDEYLTDGARSIPKLIMLDADYNEIGLWGPRPDAAQEIMRKWKETENTDKSAMLEDVQRWYIQDKGKTIQEEIISLLPQQ